MAGLLSGLKAEDPKKYNKLMGHNSDDDEDDDVNEVLGRRMSMNKFNRVGMNFQRYLENKPEPAVRREILNMFNEYKESENKEHARDELQTICNQYGIKHYQFVGYFLNNSLAEKPDDFR